MCTASIETAEMSDGDILLPGPNALAAGRVFAMEKLPRVLHLLRELCGQGLILRFNEKKISMPTLRLARNSRGSLTRKNVGAKQKNLLMNLVWDVAASEHSTRALVFEEQHALSEPLLRDRLVLDYDYRESTGLIRRMVGLSA
ncbi:4-hydroxyphenylacetate 3-hydroxylase C-terminal domain-containing protein [Pseudomonas lini]